MAKYLRKLAIIMSKCFLTLHVVDGGRASKACSQEGAKVSNIGKIPQTNTVDTGIFTRSTGEFISNTCAGRIAGISERSNGGHSSKKMSPKQYSDTEEWHNYLESLMSLCTMRGIRMDKVTMSKRYIKITK